MLPNRKIRSLSGDDGFIARGGLAVIILVILTGAYVFDLISAAVTGRNVSVSEHRSFWTIILISGVLTGISVAWNKLKGQK